MATITSNSSGNWSSGSTWVGGSKPADNDAVIIAAGHSVLMDDDTSSFTGLQTVTIQGGSTPGMLYFKSGSSGYLKIRTGYNIVGTSGTNKGRLLANSDGVWGNTGAIGNSDKAVIDLQGTARINCQYLDVALYCTQPTNKFVHCYGSKYDFNGTTNVSPSNDTIDLGTTPPSNGTSVILLLNSGASMPGGLEEDRLYYIRGVSGTTCKLATTNSDSTIVDITSVGSGTISLLTPQASGTSVLNVFEDVTGDSPWSNTAGHNRAVLVDAQAPETYDIQRVTISNITSSTITISENVDSPQFAGARLYLSSRNVSVRSAGTSTSQSIFDYVSAQSASGVFQCEIVNTAGSGSNFYCRSIQYGSGHTISGTISGCLNGIQYSSGHTISGTISGCSNGIQYGSGHIISGGILGCNYSFYFPFGIAIMKSGGMIDQTFFGRNSKGNLGRLCMEDFGKTLNAHKIVDTFGDIIKTACDGSGDSPSVDPDGGNGYCIEVSNVQSNIGNEWSNKLVIFDKHRIWLSSGNHTITYKVQTTYTGGISAGNLNLIANYISSTSPLTRSIETSSPAISQRSNASDWTQSISVSFTSAADGWVDLSMELYQYSSGNEVYIWPTPTVS